MAAYDFTMTPQTELDAVNQMLMSIGQSPVNTLAVAGIKTVNMARLHLHNVSREVQTEGWNFNTDEDYPLTKDVNGKIAVPSNVISLDPCDNFLNLVVRRDPSDSIIRFYDKDEQSFVIGKDVNVDVTWFFDFESLPQAARAYIAHKAGRVFQASGVASETIYQFTKERETETRAVLDKEERRSKDSNFFSHDTAAARIFRRQ